MAVQSPFNYRLESSRYQHYFRDLKKFYQKPITQVSSAVLFTLATIIFFAIFAIKPTLDTISELLKTIESQRVVKKQAEQKAAALGTAQQQLDQVQPYLAQLDEAIPTSMNVQKLLYQIEALASQNSLPLTALQIADLEYPEKYSTKGDIQEMRFIIQLETSYAVSKQFIKGLMQLPRFIEIDSISYNPDALNKQTKVDRILTSIECKTFINPVAKL